MNKGKKVTIFSLITIILLSILAMTVFGEDNNDDKSESNDQDSPLELAESIKDIGSEVGNDYVFPEDNAFEKVAENENLILKVDTSIGHFIVENKKTGKVVRSFPNPEAWDGDKVAQAWQVHLKSPFMFSYVEFAEREDILKESNVINQDSYIAHELIDDGIRITYEMEKLGFIIPIEIKLGDDFVETRLLANQLVDEKVFPEPEDEEDEVKDPVARLVSLRLFPFLGADSSEGEDGFLLLPDGPGVLVEFKQNRASTTNLYNERIYGNDLAFATRINFSPREEVRMPIFGIKSRDQGVLGVVHEGDIYTNVVAAPSESYSNYNWVTAEHQFRFKYFQPKNRRGTDGFFRYSDDIQRGDRAVRYYIIEQDDPSYVDLATKYREYLMKEKGLVQREATDESLKMNLSILGGGTKKGFLLDGYLSLTTAPQAMEIIQSLNSAGVDNMSIIYHGWQRKGYGKFGGHFPVSRKLGGNNEMKEFVEFAQSKGFPVYLEASSYTYNNTGKDKFRPTRDGLRDLGETVMRFRRAAKSVTLVSPKVMEKTIYKDLHHAKDLGVDGYLFGDAIGATLSTDYNKRYAVTRAEARDIQRNIIDKAREELGDIQITSSNFYAIDQISHIEQLPSDYSYDLFIDKIIPFAQISLHGLVTYSFEYGNMSGNANEAFLKSIEYGAEPAFLLTYEESHKLLESDSMYRYYSTHYKDWESIIVEQYQKFNYALKNVQNEFIVDHRELARDVFETTYENGTKIIVNYNLGPYIDGNLRVEAQDFVVIEGGN